MLRRVATRFGFLRVAELVDAVSKEELTELLAEAWIDGWDEEYLRMAHIVQELSDIRHLLLGRFGVHISKSDFKTVEDCMPEQSRPIRSKPKKEPEEPTGDDATTAWMKRTLAIYGRRA